MKIRIEIELCGGNACSDCFCRQSVKNDSGERLEVCRAFGRIIKVKPLSFNGIVKEYIRCPECIASEIEEGGK